MKIDVSNGELFDKISILEIKMKKIKNKEKLKNIKNEYKVLKPLLENFDKDFVEARLKSLVYVNTKIWEAEDELREHEQTRNFGGPFVNAARRAYQENDLRCTIKKEINLTTGSELIEEKGYEGKSEFRK